MAISIVAAVVGGVLLWLYLDRLEQRISGGAGVGVLVTLESLQSGDTLTGERLAVREVPRAYVDERFVKESERDQIAGLQLKNDVSEQQTLTWTDLALSADEPRSLSGLVPKGSRAVSVRASGGKEGFAHLRPGDCVDVIAKLPTPDGDDQAAVVLLQRIMVLAVGSDTAGGEEKTNRERRWGSDATVTLSVSLRQAQLLALAVERGSLQLALRNPEDQRIDSRISDISSAALSLPAARAAVQKSAVGPIRLGAGGS